MTKYLCDYYWGDVIRAATRAEIVASRDASKHDGGVGVILLANDGKIVASDDHDACDARRVFVVQ